MLKRNSSKASLFSSILGARSRRSNRLGRLQLFGMGGTFGHGVIKHCDTWEVAEDSPDRLSVRQDISDIAEKRRNEAYERLSGEKKKGFYDFLNR